MMTIFMKIRPRLGAFVITALLALGWLTMPISLAAWESDVCEMECCVAAGHCCCETRHAYVKGREPKPDEVTLKLETGLTAPCPATCTSSTTVAQKHLQRSTPAPSLFVTLTIVLIRHWSEQTSPDHPFAARPSSPRAPPVPNRLHA